MNLAPMPIIAFIVLVLGFEGLIYGSDIAAASFPQASAVDYDQCQGITGFGAGIETVGCYIGQTWNFVVNIFKVIFGGLALLWNLASFNIPGAPTFIRWFLGGIIGTGIVLVIVVILRGN